MSDNWSVYEVDDGVHVVPTRDGEIIGGHVLSWGCPCGPDPVREGPLDDPVASHREPSHPGAEPSLLS